MGEDSKNSSGRGILRAFGDAAMRGARAYDRLLTSAVDHVIGPADVSYTSEFIPEELADLRKKNARKNFDAAMDILDCIPETHDLLHKARTEGYEIVPNDAEIEGKTTGMHSRGSRKIIVMTNFGQSREREYGAKEGLQSNGRDRQAGYYTKWISHTMAHELKHFAQHERNGKETGKLTVTAREHLIVTRAVEGDAEAFAAVVDSKVDTVIALKKGGMSNEQIRDHLKNSADPKQEKDFMQKVFLRCMTDKDMHGYDQNSAELSVKWGAETGRIPMHASKFLEGQKPERERGYTYHSPIAASEVCRQLRYVVGDAGYLDDIGDRDLLKSILRPVDPEARKVIWATDARERAANREKGLLPAKEKALTEKIEAAVAAITPKASPAP